MRPSADPTCVLALDFAEPGGNTVYDLSGKGNNGTIYGATRVKGPLGGGLYFDGVDDYVLVHDDDSLDITEELTIELYTKVFNFPPSWAAFLLKTTSGKVKDWPYGLIVYSDGDVSFGIGDGTALNFLTNQVFINAGIWYHIVAIVDKNNIYIFVDGTQKGSMNRTIDPLTNNEAIRIGRGGIWFLDCVIANIRIYNRALSEREIREHYYYLTQQRRRARRWS